MTLSAAPSRPQQQDEAGAVVSVLLLDTPENLGVDFLQMLQRQEFKLAFERVNDREGLYAALRSGNWNLLLVCDQVNVPGQDETLAFLRQIDSETGYVLLSKTELSIDALTRAYRKGIAAVVSAQYPEYSLQVFAREAERCRRNLQLSLLQREKGDLKRHCQQLMSGTQEALAYLQDGIHVFGNEAYLKLLGYKQLDELLVLPFIDLVSMEMREKTKQRLLAYQHRARLQPDLRELEIPELFVNAVGDREGVLQVAATFKPVVYEGESCVQVVFKYSSGDDKAEESSSAEGLGYPLFIAHLDNLVAQARAAGRPCGQVLHVRGRGCEHYIARRGYGSLNGKLKALTSELKSVLGNDDLLIRFTATSFLLLHRSGNEAQMHATLTALLARFDKALNRELDAAPDARLIAFTLDALPVTADAPAAEAIVRGFLQPGAAQTAETPLAAPAPLAPGADVRETQDDRPAAQAPQASAMAKAPGFTPPAIDPPRLAAALAANQLQLLYETVISVADIETDFHDICVGLPSADGDPRTLPTPLSRILPAGSELAAKLDQWTLHHTLAVVADLYARGQEYPVMLALSAKSLANRNLADTLRGELQSFGLPAGMLLVDFALDDLNGDVENGVAQLERLKAAGLGLCISEVHDISALKEVLKQVRVERIRLQRAFVEVAATDAQAFNVLRQSVERLHGLKMKVFAGDVASNSELAMCCKAGIDLVKGKCIQKSPQPLDADAMAEALMA